ncbi:MAG: NAD(P)H-hydrate dehydratase [Desulfohalobiaceae bacterium]
MHTPLPTPQEMARWDSMAIHEFGLRGEILMENASRECLQVLKDRLGPLEGRTAVIFAGSGNNGGDAFALARHLSDEGVKLLVLHTRKQAAYQGESAYHLGLAQKRNLTLFHLPEYNLDFLNHADILVDGLLGTGFEGELRQSYRGWITHINRMAPHCFVLSIDIPSGLNGVTGRPCPTAVQADATVTFEEAKLGLLLPSARPYVGDLLVRRIGIPRFIQEDHPPSHFALTACCLDLIPDNPPDMHKGSAGHLLVVGGSTGLTGAPAFAALGALRAGAGLVTVACPGGLSTEIKAGWPEIMTLPLGGGREWTPDLLQELAPHLERFDALVLGPGLGRGEQAGRFVTALVQPSLPPLVLDADGLYWLAKDDRLCSRLPRQSVLTPHPGEMARILERSTREVQDDRFDAARALCRTHGGVTVLKGAGTVITAPDQPDLLCPLASPALAVGGTGDVLSGVIGRLLARGLSPLHAACVGVYWHGSAGLLVERDYPHRGNLTREIADALPLVLKETHT